MNDEYKLKVSKIRNGTVIDHIAAGEALDVLGLLGISGKEQNTISVAMHVASERVDSKDVVKIEGKELSEDEINVLSVVSPEATINIVRDYEVVDKYRVTRPDKITGAIDCPNPNCISSMDKEPIESRFIVGEGEMRCDYCDTILEHGIAEHLDL